LIPSAVKEIAVTNNEEWTSTFLRWADDGSVAIGFAEYIGEPPKEVWGFEVPADTLSAEEVAKRVLEFTQELQAGIEFTLDVRRKYISWGADVSAFEVLLTISASILSSLASTAIQEKISYLRRQLSGADQGAEPLSRDQATGQAKRKVAVSYDVKRDDLLVRAEEENRQENTWTVDLQHADGTRYSVVIGSIGGRPQRFVLGEKSVPRTNCTSLEGASGGSAQPRWYADAAGQGASRPTAVVRGGP
jgi:hypothetical protein